MCRCKACDNVLQENELIWRDFCHAWEDLCGYCRNIVDTYELGYYAAIDKHKKELEAFNISDKEHDTQIVNYDD